MKARLLAAVSFSYLVALGVVSANALPILVEVDENGFGGVDHEIIMPWSMMLEPNSHMTTLAYQLPYVVNQGDVVLPEASGGLSDLIRFWDLNDPDDNSIVRSYLFFFSDNGDGEEDLADVGLPTQLLANQVTLPEEDTLYIPGPNDPGWGDVYRGLNYRFLSDADGAIPEPSTLLVWTGLGALGLVAAWRRRKRAA